jgi:hypothetical protein
MLLIVLSGFAFSVASGSLDWSFGKPLVCGTSPGRG